MNTIFLGELNDTPVGDLRLAASDLGLVALEWADSQPQLEAFLNRLDRSLEQNPRRIRPYSEEIMQYLLGRRREFSFSIDWGVMREFQRKVLKIVFKIPYGETRTYSEIAVALGRPKAPRAVGRANATNPIPLVIPCHRVIGADGKLHGYGGGKGLPTKEWLLKMEGAVLS